jgi:hypothetical protein
MSDPLQDWQASKEGENEMPNDVTTRCIVTGSAKDVQAFRARMIIKTDDEEESRFDFERIVPVPAAIEECEVSLEMLLEAHRESPDGRLPESILEKARKSKEIDAEGWYYSNWGTKWNSYEFRLLSEDPLEFAFDTGWRFPDRIFEALAREFPTLQFKCVAFDEGWRFAGEGCFNPEPGETPFHLCAPTKELCQRVFGERRWWMLANAP